MSNFIAVFLFGIGWLIGDVIFKSCYNHVEQVGHTESKAHITCYSKDKKIYEAFVKSIDKDNQGFYHLTEERNGKKITVNGDCVVEE